jgi:hypothetical protein
MDIIGPGLISGSNTISGLVANMSMEDWHVSAMTFEGTAARCCAAANGLNSRNPNNGLIIAMIAPSHVCGEVSFPKDEKLEPQLPTFSGTVVKKSTTPR